MEHLNSPVSAPEFHLVGHKPHQPGSFNKAKFTLKSQASFHTLSCRNEANTEYKQRNTKSKLKYPHLKPFITYCTLQCPQMLL